MHSTNKNLIAISGAPGAGKTTLLNVLQSRGYTCVHEVARHIIQEQMQSGGTALPWQDTTTYINLMFQKSIASFLQHQHAQHPTFFDRGLPDTLGYAHIIQLPDQRAIEEACDLHRYAKIFLAHHGAPSTQQTPNASRPSKKLSPASMQWSRPITAAVTIQSSYR
jgi:predicted ATPase